MKNSVWSREALVDIDLELAGGIAPHFDLAAAAPRCAPSSIPAGGTTASFVAMQNSAGQSRRGVIVLGRYSARPSAQVQVISLRQSAGAAQITRLGVGRGRGRAKGMFNDQVDEKILLNYIFGVMFRLV